MTPLCCWCFLLYFYNGHLSRAKLHLLYSLHYRIGNSSNVSLSLFFLTPIKFSSLSLSLCLNKAIMSSSPQTGQSTSDVVLQVNYQVPQSASYPLANTAL